MAQQIQIAIIEDNRQMSEMISDYLKEKFSSANISVFHTGESALSEITSPPDVIILD